MPFLNNSAGRGKMPFFAVQRKKKPLSGDCFPSFQVCFFITKKIVFAVGLSSIVVIKYLNNPNSTSNLSALQNLFFFQEIDSDFIEQREFLYTIHSVNRLL